MDKRGHQPVRQLLYDIGDDTLLPAGDVQITDPDKRIFLVEIKESGDLLNAITSGRLYEQARNMSQASTASFLIVQGIMVATKDGFLKADYRVTRWKYSSVMGILIDLSLKGIVVIHTSSDYATALVIRTLVSQVNGDKRPEIMKQKVFGFREKESDQLRLVASLPGINLTLARDLLQRFHYPRRIFTASEGDLMDCPGIGPARAKKIREVIDGYEGG